MTPLFYKGNFDSLNEKFFFRTLKQKDLRIRRIILGVGAQKAGTTWFYDQISKSETFKKPAAKELHVLDAVYLHDSLPFRKKTLTRFSESIIKNPKSFGKTFASKKMHMLFDIDQYFKYFDEIIGTGEFSCDITPTYSGLPVEVLSMVKEKFDALGIEVSVVFFMREPVSRLESAIRMNIRKSGKNGNFEKISPENIVEMLRNKSTSDADRLRSNYRETHNNIISTFGEENCLIGFFETMFTDVEQTKMAKFIGIDKSLLSPEVPSNQTVNKIRYESSVIDELRSNYDDQYDFVVNDLGMDESLWKNALDSLRQ